MPLNAISMVNTLNVRALHKHNTVLLPQQIYVSVLFFHILLITVHSTRATISACKRPGSPPFVLACFMF